MPGFARAKTKRSKWAADQAKLVRKEGGQRQGEWIGFAVGKKKKKKKKKKRLTIFPF